MRLLLNELTVNLDYGADALERAAARRLGMAPGQVRLEKIIRRAVDARPRRPRPCYVVNAVFTTSATVRPGDFPKTAAYEPPAEINPEAARAVGGPAAGRPVVIGCGPAGLAAAYYLARAGARPLLLERGQPIDRRRPAVGAFWGRGSLDPENNALYGEGGAGAFSDGKLTSRGKDLAGKDFVMAMLVAGGAPESIAYDAQAHLGSDVLARVIPAVRRRIVELGGEVRFGVRADGWERAGGHLAALRVTADGREERVPCSACVLAAGHSADDVYRALARDGAALDGKGYALGVRVELPQARVDKAQWGRFLGDPRLGAASFFLTCGGRCHTFCMCPGGRVIACAAVPGTLATNGMSLSPRRGKYANAAFLVPQEADGPDGTAAALARLERLAALEQKVFAAGGGDYCLPATTLAAFPAAGVLPERSCARARAADFREFLPPGVVAALRECLPVMLRQLGNPPADEVVLYGAETRSTSVIRVLRGEDGQSVTLPGLYPAGEGAGYAGGIVSSAVDGARAAEKLWRALNSPA